MQQQAGHAPDPQLLLQWAQFYAFTMGWVLQPITKPIGYTHDGRQICSCELTGKKWANCNPEKPGKHPWRGWKQAPMETPEQGYSTFFNIWQQYPHGVNIGVRTGRVSGMWALDLDMGAAKNGALDLGRWLAQQGMGFDDIETLGAMTGGGGFHYVFGYPNEVEKIPTVAPHAEIGPSVDVKGDGGYILVAPSVHSSGRLYEWNNGVIAPDTIRPAPQKVINIVQKKKRSVGAVDISYTPALEELKDYGDELKRKKSKRSSDVGRNMLKALNGLPIAEDGGAHDAYRDIMYFVAKRWPRCDPAEILEHFEESVAARFAHKADASTDMSNLIDSMQTALEKANEEAKSWIGQIAVNDQGNPIATDANILLYFRNHPAWKEVLGYNMRRNRPVYLKKPPLPDREAGEFEMARDKSEISLWFQSRALMRGRISKDDLQSALITAAWDFPFDPLANLVGALRGQWDGVPRLETALQRIAGSPDTPWVRLVFPTWMKSLVRRILQPGCKADCMFILEGPQGYKKSTFFSSLLPDTRFFSDSLSKVRHDIESIRLIHSGPAIFELGELSGLRKQEIEDVKAFLSAFQDDLRPLYEPPRSTLRRCVFVGTTNRNDYLRDETGGRRFWPVKVTKPIDIEQVYAEREQWFAEALAGLDAGGFSWLEGDAADDLARAEQEERYEEDIWEQPISDWLADEAPPQSEREPSTSTEQMNREINKSKAGQYVTTVQVALYALKVELKNARTAEGARINKILRRLGWTPKVFRDDNKIKRRGWERPTKK